MKNLVAKQRSKMPQDVFGLYRAAFGAATPQIPLPCAAVAIDLDTKQRCLDPKRVSEA
jgi:hypothetical protein